MPREDYTKLDFNNKDLARLPPSHLGDGLDDEELPIHPEMIRPWEEEYDEALYAAVEVNSHVWP